MDEDAGTDLAARNAEFSLFYLSDMPKLTAFLIVQDVPVSLAKDIAQEAMTAAYISWDNLDSPRAWVRTVALRKWWKLAPKHRAELPCEELPEPSGLLTDAEAAEIEQRHTVVARLRRLPAAQREVMAWRYDEYEPAEIAAILGKEPATVRSLLRLARAALRADSATAEEAP